MPSGPSQRASNRGGCSESGSAIKSPIESAAISAARCGLRLAIAMALVGVAVKAILDDGDRSALQACSPRAQRRLSQGSPQPSGAHPAHLACVTDVARSCCRQFRPGSGSERRARRTGLRNSYGLATGCRRKAEVPASLSSFDPSCVEWQPRAIRGPSGRSLLVRSSSASNARWRRSVARTRGGSHGRPTRDPPRGQLRGERQGDV